MIGPDGICMWCAELISATKLQEEGLTPEQTRFAQYVPGVVAPSVITMNALSSALALNDFLFSMTGLFQTSDLRSGITSGRGPSARRRPARTTVSASSVPDERRWATERDWQ